MQIAHERARSANPMGNEYWGGLRKSSKSDYVIKVAIPHLIQFEFLRSDNFTPMEWPAKAPESDFGAIRTKPKRRRASPSSRPKNHGKLLQGTKRWLFANTGVFLFPTLDSDGMACKGPRNRLWYHSDQSVGAFPVATFGCFPPTAWVWCQPHQSRSVGAFAGHSTRIHCWNLENTSVSKSASFCSLEHLLAVFPRLLGFGANRIKVGLLVLSQAIPPESTVGTWKIPASVKSAPFCTLEQLLAVLPRLEVEGSPALGFGANRIKVGLLVLWQAVRPESTVGTWKIPASAKVPRFAPWSNFWRFPPDCNSRALLRLGLVPIASSRSVGAFAGRSTRIHCWNLENTSVSKSASYCSLEQLLAVFPRQLGFGANRIKVGLFVLSPAIPSESTVGTWKIPASAKVPRLASWSNFWRFSPNCKSRALLRLVWCQSHQSRSVGAFAGRSTRIHCWNLENTSVSKSASFCSLEQLLAVFARLQVEGSPALGFLCQPHQSRSVGAFAGRSTRIHC